MSVLPVVLRETGLAKHINDLSIAGQGAFSRRVIGIIQYCGLCDTDYHSSSACGCVRFSGTTRATRITSASVHAVGDCEARGIFAVLCLRNAELEQSLLVVESSTGARHSATLVSGDLLVAPANSVLCFGGTSGDDARALVAEYFVATFYPCSAATDIPTGFGFDTLPGSHHDKDKASSAAKTEILYPLKEPAE